MTLRHARGQSVVEIAAALLGAPGAEDVAIGDGTFSAAGKSVSWKSVCAKLPGEVLVATGERASIRLPGNP